MPNSSFILSTQKNFFVVRENGLFILRSASQKIAANVFEFYDNIFEESKYDFQVILMIGIIFLSLSQIVLIPIVFKVH